MAFLFIILLIENAHELHDIFVNKCWIEKNESAYFFLHDLRIFLIPAISFMLLWKPPANNNFRFACLSLAISFYLDVAQMIVGLNLWGWHLEVIAILVANVGYWVSSKE